MDWNEEAKCILKAEFARKGYTYADVSLALNLDGMNESPENLRNKLSRGTFTAAFFLRCLSVLKVKEIRLG